MANMYFSRDTKVYLHARMSSSTAVPDRYYEIPVLDGFSFSQATNATEVTLNEAQNTSGASRRGRKMFNDSLAPAEWSFSTYIQPFIAATGGTVGTGGAAAATTGGVTHVREVSEALWAGLLADTVNGAINTVAAGTASTSLDYVQIQSNSATLGVFDLYFVLGGATDSDRNYTVDTNDSAVMIYKIADCSVNEASIDFDLDGIATVNWSGMGSVISENPSKNFSTSVYEGVGKTNTFIRNRVSDLTIVATTPTSGTFNATMTGGNITISNNLTYLTPDTLGTVNQPLGHVTGTRTIGGSFTCYADPADQGSVELFENLIENTDTVTNSNALTFDIGGGVAPYFQIKFDQAHLEIPTHSIEDVISMEFTFHALPSTMSATDEISTMKFVGV